ncbi:MATE family efflux transporter [Solihabitans fulvus]|uniref:MATE family efflux transporter n=1 Tax=Solihabitans fulvus TaxID=1892852 RepID=UPI0023E7E8E2|nr:MATE family efflux transporter [Solihabitans fulvus]
MPARRVFGLAVPALGVLAVEPLYVLVDTAVVGHLGALPLAGLAIGGLVLAQIAFQLTFLSYGTTARASRLYGAGRRADAVAEGVQATWLALAVGVLLLVLGEVFAGPITSVLTGNAEVADAAARWLRIALFGAPLILVTAAGNGWMRGVQDTARPLRYVLLGNALSAVLCPVLVFGAGWGLAGSAVANVAAQLVAASLFLRALVTERVSLRPVPAKMLAQLALGRDLVVRGLAFQACFVSAAAVAARTSTSAVGAHQVVLQLWFFVAMALDSLAIAAQSLVGAALGAGEERRARGLANQVARYGLVFGTGLGLLFAALSWVLPRAFTPDAGVLAEIPHAWWFFVALQPAAGVLFAFDGVLFGAGDAAFLRNSSVFAAVLGFLPLVWLSLALGWGLAGIWTGLTAFMVLRLGTALVRIRSGRWAVTGAVHA